MVDLRRKVRSRPKRLLAYLTANRDQMVIDMTVLLAWIIALWAVFGFFELPRWILYIVLFVGVIAYSRITPTWERPYRSPGTDENGG